MTYTSPRVEPLLDADGAYSMYWVPWIAVVCPFPPVTWNTNYDVAVVVSEEFMR